MRGQLKNPARDDLVDHAEDTVAAGHAPPPQTVMDAALAIISTTTPQALVDEVARRAVQLTGARAGIARVRGGSGASGIQARVGALSGARPDLVVPLRSRDGGTVGEIGVEPPADSTFSSAAEQLLAQLAAFASTALENMRLYHAMAEAQAQREAFFGILSHELRTPITTIYGGSRMLVQADGRLSNDAQREIQADIAADAERLYRLIEDLLVLTRSEHGSLQVAPEPCAPPAPAPARDRFRAFALACRGFASTCRPASRPSQARRRT